MTPPGKIRNVEDLSRVMREALNTPAMQAVLRGPAISEQAQQVLNGIPTPASDIGEIHGLTLSPAPRIGRTAEGSIPVDRDAIGRTLREGRAHLERRLAGGPGHHTSGHTPYLARLHMTHVAHAPTMRVAHSPLVPNGHAPVHGHASATAGRAALGSQRQHPFINRGQIKTGINNGSLHDGDRVFLRNSFGVVQRVRIHLNSNTHKIHLSPA